MVLIANKCDMPWSRRQVMFDEGLAFSKQHGMLFVEFSAKTGQNVDMAFQLSTSWLLYRLEKTPN